MGTQRKSVERKKFAENISIASKENRYRKLVSQ